MILTFGRFHTRTWWWWSWWWSWCYNDDDSWRWVLVRHEGQCAPECTVVYSGVQWSVSVLRLSQSQLYSETSDTHYSILFQTNHSEALTYWVTSSAGGGCTVISDLTRGVSMQYARLSWNISIIVSIVKTAAVWCAAYDQASPLQIITTAESWLQDDSD